MRSAVRKLPAWCAVRKRDYTSLVALAKCCAAHAKDASQARQTDIDDAELPLPQQREEEFVERATFAEAADAQKLHQFGDCESK